ncbi:putative membrane protein [Hoeflea marina]|uniref:Protoporphyrinogen IX oxidase n=1 Tax=Hoeflea marina TaxID=274592 RepID=A0A317PQ28_9HYPH|nr:protoporphyrinogen oxidase HemJ [Hoeflea marina]PWW00551.1 putative membrane protein [Hoeflea marina]
MSEPTTGAAEGRKARNKAFASIALVLVLAGAGIVYQPEWIYPWLKVLHVAAVISWMVGLFYLPRIFVYHSEADRDGDAASTFAVMEARLLKVIMRPAMLVVWGSGLWLAWKGFGFYGPWLWVKIAAVVGLTAFHGFLSQATRRFASGSNRFTARQWRMVNEIPTLLMLVALIMVIVKPFA